VTTTDLDDQIARLADDLEAVYEDFAIPAATRQLPPPDPETPQRAKIVVVGEVRAGKTALINAILGRGELLPMTPTRQFVMVGAGEHDHVRVQLADGQTDTHGIDELNAAVSAAELPDKAIAHVEVLLDEPMLTEMTLVDTPGLGGVEFDATPAALLALEDATAVIFVCAAGEKISLLERDFLVQAAACIDHVVFVLSKTDRPDDGGAANLAENKEAIAQRRPQRISNFTFLRASAKLASIGAGGDTEALAESGIEELRHCLREVSDSRHLHTRRNALRQIRESLSTAYTVRARRKDTLEQPDTTAAQLAAVQARLDDLNRHRGRWQTLMNRAMTEAQWAAQAELDVHKKDLADRYRGLVDAATSKEDLKDVAHKLNADLTQWWVNTPQTVDERVRQLVDDLNQAMISFDLDALLASVDTPGSTIEGCLSEAKRNALRRGDIIGHAQGVSGLGMAVRNMTEWIADLDLGGAAGPVAFLLYLVKHLSTKGVTERKDLQRRIDDAIAKAKTIIDDNISQQFRRIAWKLEDALPKEIDDAVAEARAALNAINQGADTRRIEADRVKKLAAALDPLLERWNGLYSGVLALDTPKDMTQI
jgi:hypothetical protein